MEIKTNKNRLWESIMQMAKIGPGLRGGNFRLALTDSDIEGRNIFTKCAKEAGCILRLDSMGNIFARREGKISDASLILSGSHLDTQPSGGKFDGILGVLGGLEVIRTLNDFSIDTDRPLRNCSMD